MKHIRLYLTTLAAVLMAACSSMEVDDNELYAENFPKDFVDSVYMELHPELVSLQIKQFVKDHNDSLKTNMDADRYQKMYDKDTAAFSQDTSVLHEIFVTPFYVGFPEEDWVDVWTPITTYDVNCVTNMTYREVYLVIGSDTAKTKVYVDSVKFDEKGNFASIYGKTDSTAASKEFVIGDTISYYNKGAVYDSTEVCDSVEVIQDGQLSAIQKSLVVSFNMYDKDNDLAALKKVPIDTKAVVYQYLVYGKLHGWTYRYCAAAEKKNPVRPVLDVSETTDKLYCDDNGVAREIK